MKLKVRQERRPRDLIKGPKLIKWMKKTVSYPCISMDWIIIFNYLGEQVKRCEKILLRRLYFFQ